MAPVQTWALAQQTEFAKPGSSPYPPLSALDLRVISIATMEAMAERCSMSLVRSFAQLLALLGIQTGWRTFPPLANPRLEVLRLYVSVATFGEGEDPEQAQALLRAGYDLDEVKSATSRFSQTAQCHHIGL